MHRVETSGGMPKRNRFGQLEILNKHEVSGVFGSCATVRHRLMGNGVVQALPSAKLSVK